MSSAFGRAFVPTVIGGVVLSIASCYSPTQFIVEVTTDYGCPNAPGAMSITAGALGRVESASPSAVSAKCDNGNYGTLVIVPSGARDDDVLVKVVASIGRPVETCTPPYGKGCIVARRSLRFLKHQSLRLPILMRASCDGVPCDELDTCVNGQCKPALIDPGRCTGDGCTEDELFKDVPPVDAGGDAPPVDAGTDAPLEVGVDADDGIEPPRLLAPLSTSTVSSSTPLLRWVNGSGTDGTMIEVCEDRACTTILDKLALGKGVTEVTVGSALPTNRTSFWRGRGAVGGKPGNRTSPTWQLFVPPPSNEGVAQTSISYGTRLDLNGDGRPEVAIGSPNEGNGGAVHVYAASGLTTLMAPAGATGFGAAVASAGDVNGDGYGDLIVGSNALGDPPVFIFHGGPNGIAPKPAEALTTGTADTSFGSAVASAGDVNGDGYADVLIGAPAANSGAGRAYVFYGGAGGPINPLLSTTLVPMTESPNMEFGFAVAGAADFDGDGFADVVVGAPSTGSPAGSAHVFKGSLTGPISVGPIGASIGAANNGVSFGSSLAIGDVDASGYSDLIVGVPGAKSSNSQDAGGYAIFVGSPTGLTTTAAVAATVEDIAGARYGTAVAFGDLDYDGYADALVTGPGAQRVAAFSGQGGGAFALQGFPLVFPAGMNGTKFGASIAAVGDHSANGRAQILVGAPSPAGGAAFLYNYVPGFGLDAPTAFNAAPSNFGISVARRPHPGRAKRHR